jgi:hypothetical protein
MQPDAGILRMPTLTEAIHPNDATKFDFTRLLSRDSKNAGFCKMVGDRRRAPLARA